MKKRLKKIYGSKPVLFMALAALFGTGLVQVHTAAAQEEAKSTLKLEALTVTAQKKEENVQEVPMGMSVFSDIQVEESGAADNTELIRFMPNVHVYDTGNQNQITIRGVSGFVNALYSASGLYVNDINYPTIYAQNPKLFDIERVEVLKGPQGTLYGRNSESGVINIITKQPDDTVRGSVSAEVSIYDTEHGSVPRYEAGGNISGPVAADKLYLGVAGQWEKSDGFVTNEENGDDEAGAIDRKNGRATLRWTPTAPWDISLVLEAMDSNDRYGYGKYIEGAYATERQAISWDVDENDWNQSENTQALRISYAGEAFNLLSVTARHDYEEDTRQDMDMTPYNLYGAYYGSDGSLSVSESDEILTQEVRLSSPEGEGPFEWLGGLYGFDEQINIDQAYYQELASDIDVDGVALFGQGTYTLHDRLHLTAGLRYDYTESDGSQVYTAYTGLASSYAKSLENDELLPKVAVSYDFTDGIMGYLSVSEGYLAGGYDYSSATSVKNLTYGPEYTWNYEIGAKTSWLDDRLIVNLSVYYISMDDKQVSEVNPTTLLTSISNAAEAHSVGGELELQARLSQGLDLFAGVGYTQAEIDEWTATEWNSAYTAMVQYDYEGKSLPNTPDTTYNLGLSYHHPRGFFGRVDLLGTGAYYYNAKNTIKQDAYQLVNLKLGHQGEHFDITLWSKNLFNEEYDTSRFEYLALAAIEGAPRSFGTTLTYRF